MKRIPQHIIEQIIQDSDIVDVISEHLTLTKAGSNFKASCPFHQEKTASFMVSPDKQIFHCFGCGVGGNVLSFVMKHEQIEFIEAIKKLAERLGIKLEQHTKDQNSNDPRDNLYKVNAYAGWYYQQQLSTSQKAKNYLAKRNLTNDIIETYKLGYAPDGFENLVPFLTQKKIPLDYAKKLGLIKPGKKGGHYDFFRDRLIFPIHNATGKVVAFGGRTLAQNENAKYLNSPESPIYYKTSELYGLYQAKKSIAQNKQAIVVEGYIDVLACAQLGFTQTVAPLGTSLTLDQVKKLNRFTKEIVLMFDGDDAGLNAGKKAINTCFSAGIHPKIIILQDNLDPGDFLDLKDGKTKLNQALNNAIYAMDWLLASNLKKTTSEAGLRAKIMTELGDWLKQLPDRMEQIEYRKKFCQYFDISPQDLEKVVEITPKSDNVSRLEKKQPPLEALIILSYINDRDEFGSYDLSFYAKDFESTVLKELAFSIQNFLKNHETFDLSHAILELPDKTGQMLSKLLLLGDELKAKPDTQDCLQNFKSRQLKKRLKEITAQIVEAEVAKDTSRKLTLLQEKQSLIKAQNKIK